MIDLYDREEMRPVVYGFWIPVDKKQEAFRCSECEEKVQKRYNFCPVCGADMRPQE